MVRSGSIFLFLSIASICAGSYGSAQQPEASMTQATSVSEPVSRYTTDEWLTIAPHLPDPKTSTPEKLLTAADVLRARRFPEEAIEYYRYALERGGDQVVLLNRIGVTELDRGQAQAARIYFRQVTVLKKKYAEAWNNLGATEDMLGDYASAISDYQRAIKLNRKNATFHANLGTAYFARADYESGRHEYGIAVKLDSNVMRRGSLGGTMIQVISSSDRGRFAFEMARLAAAQGDEDEMLHWLSVAAETGFNLADFMKSAKEFEPYQKDARVKLILKNVKAMHPRQVLAGGPVPQLPAPESSRTHD